MEDKLVAKTAFNMVIVGVGGQGILLSSKILGQLAMDRDLDVRVSEVHGMAQRGGSVITHVRVGEGLFTPMVADCSADYVVSFEILETQRALHYLKKNGTVITSTQRIKPATVKLGMAEYPEDPLTGLSDAKLIKIDALQLAIEAGNKKCVNIVLLGVLSNMLDFTEEEWLKAIKSCVKEKTYEMNVVAFGLGRNATK